MIDAPTAPAGANDAAALANLIRDTVAAGVPRDALHLCLSRLGAPLRPAHHNRMVEEALAPALRLTRGRLFALPNGDLVAVAPPGGPHLPAAQEALAALFAGESAIPALALLRLPGEAAALLAILEGAFEAPPRAASTASPRPAARAGFPATALAAAERDLAGASLDAFLRLGAVCRLDAEDPAPRTLWREATIDRDALCATLLPGVDPAAAPGLAARLARLLDRRLLAELAQPGEARRGVGLGLALRPASLADPAFLRLDAALAPEGRARATLWFAAADILDDPARFAFLRGVLQARGYRLGLDAPHPRTLALLPPDRTQVALVRFPWRADLPAPGSLRAGLPAGRVVLTAADRAAAIGWGWEAGISLFQGRLLPGH